MSNITPLNIPQLKLAEHAYQTFQAEIPVGVSLEDVTDPNYWTYVSQRVNARDEIRCIAEDGSWLARLIVVAKSPKALRVKVLEAFDLDSKPIDEMASPDAPKDIYKVAWKGPQRRFAVVHAMTGDIVEGDIDDKEVAENRCNELNAEKQAA